MSNRLLSACWPLQMPSSAKAVLISLADRASDDQGGTCYPSVSDLCARTCLTRRTVQHALKWLAEHDAIQRELCQRENGSQTSSWYVVTPENFQAMVTPGAQCLRPPAQVQRGGCAPRAPLEPSVEPQDPIPPIAPKGASQSRRQKERHPAVTIKEWLRQCKAAGQAPIPAGCAALVYVRQADIPDEFLALYWAEFKARNSDNDMRRKNWIEEFGKSISRNRYRLWSVAADGRYTLTSLGLQAERVQGNKGLVDVRPLR